MDRMITEIRNATSVDSANSTLGSSPGILTINTSGSPSVIKFDGSTSTFGSGAQLGSAVGDFAPTFQPPMAPSSRSCASWIAYASAVLRGFARP